MQSIDSKNLRTFLYGALDIDQRSSGISPRRLPDWTRPQVPPIMDVMVRMPSGVRLIFETDSTRVSITALTTNMLTPPAAKKPVVFDLELNGEIYSSQSLDGNTLVLDSDDPTKFELVRGQVVTFEFPELPPGLKRCELWLPHNAFVELQHLNIDDDAIFQPVEHYAPKWIHYGSSISHCMEATQPAKIWPAVAARQAGATLQNLGLAGQCHLDQFVARTIRDADADIISLKIGINIVNMDSMRERVFKPALHGFLDTIRESKPKTPIILISPIYCPSAENAPGPTLSGPDGKFVTVAGHEEIRTGCLSVSRIRQLTLEVLEARHDPDLHYVSGLDLFGEQDQKDLPDDLHPNQAGYIRMGERFANLKLTSMIDELKRTAKTNNQ